MSWVKRNLYFLFSSLVALVLLGLAGYYFYSNWSLNNSNLEKLNTAYGLLDQLIKSNPRDEHVDNILTAQQQLTNVVALIEKEKKFFLRVAPIPDSTNGVITKDEFASALRRTIDDLGHAAAAASVTLPPKYNFSFQAQRDLTVFVEGSLPPLATQLGEIKAVCNVLFQAKINSLDNLRRERVSADDARGPQSDYLETTSVTGPMAVLTPYEVSFHCFSPELAGVLAGFAGDPHGFIVQAVNVESAAQAQAGSDVLGWPGYAGMAPAAAPATKGGLPVLLDEKQLKVTLVLQVTKLLQKN